MNSISAPRRLFDDTLTLVVHQLKRGGDNEKKTLHAFALGAERKNDRQPQNFRRFQGTLDSESDQGPIAFCDCILQNQFVQLRSVNRY